VNAAGVLILKRVAFTAALAVEVEDQSDKEPEEQQKGEFGNIEGANDIGSVHFIFLSWNNPAEAEPGR
jgi:hypothetical protein